MTKTGMCVGGPLAGQHKAEHGTFFSVVMEPPIRPLSEKPDLSPVDYHFTTITYIYHELPLGDDVIGLWIPQGGTVAWAIREVLETYSMYEDLK